MNLIVSENGHITMITNEYADQSKPKLTKGFHHGIIGQIKFSEPQSNPTKQCGTSSSLPNNPLIVCCSWAFSQISVIPRACVSAGRLRTPQQRVLCASKYGCGLTHADVGKLPGGQRRKNTEAPHTSLPTHRVVATEWNIPDAFSSLDRAVLWEPAPGGTRKEEECRL